MKSNRLKTLSLLALASVGLSATAASAGLIQSQTFAGSPLVFNNGGGADFGGPLGAGSLSFNVSGPNLDIRFTAGATLNDIVALYLDTRTGGFTDAQMNDSGDGGRTAISNLTRDLNDNFPISPDFGIAIGNFGVVLFELNAGTENNHLIFRQFVDQVGGIPQTISIPLADLGSPSQVDFFAAYASGGGYSSNESLPADPARNDIGNPGFGNGQDGGLNPPPASVDYSNYNRVVLAVPEASSLAVLSLPAAAMLGRRRKLA